MDWPRQFAYITGTVDQELLLRRIGGMLEQPLATQQLGKLRPIGPTQVKPID